MTSATKRRTYSKADWDAAQVAWTALRLPDEWKPWRHMAAMEAGIIAAPEGSIWDSWADEDPSQLALLTRAIRDTPDVLRSALRSPNVHSWSAVIAIVTRHRDDRLEDVERREREWVAVKERRPMARIGSVMTTIADSLGMEERA